MSKPLAPLQSFTLQATSSSAFVHARAASEVVKGRSCRLGARCPTPRRSPVLPRRSKLLQRTR